MLLEPLAEFASRFDRSLLQPQVEKAERQRHILRAKFPREALAELALEKYAVGRGPGTLCYEYEYATPELGSIKGGSAGKFGVFFRPKTQTWQSALPGEPDPARAWVKLRAGLVQALSLCEEGRWDETDSVPDARSAPSLRMKMAHVFFPEQVLPVYATSQLDHFLSKLGVQSKGQNGQGAGSANHRLLGALRAIPLLRDWHTTELAGLLYSWSPPPKKAAALSFKDFASEFDRTKLQALLEKAEQEQSHILETFPRDRLAEVPLERYASGVEVAEDTLSNLLTHRTSVLGDIRGAAFSKVGIQKLKGTGLYKSHLKGAGNAAEDWLRLRRAFVQCFELAEHGQWGAIDGVAVSSELPDLRTKLLYVYFPQEVLPIYRGAELRAYADKLKLDTHELQTKAGPAAWNRHLLQHLRTMPELEDWSSLEMVLALREWSPATQADAKSTEGDNEESANSNFNWPMTTPSSNKILYGPPGTGKTYRAIREAVRIVTGLEPPAEEAQQRFDELVQKGRIRLATFHQSFGYEDFVEGIRPVMDGTGGARFEVRDGVFKEMAREALFACLERSQPGAKAAPSNSLIAAPDEVSDTVIPLEAEHDSDLARRRPGAGTETGLVWDLADNLSEARGRLATRKEVVVAAIEQGINTNTANTQFYFWQKSKGSAAAEPGTLPSYSDSRPASSAEVATDKSSIVEEYLTLGSASGWMLRPASARPRYVLVIDEINRGNISRIFGELITLVEDDKRLGNDSGLTVTLPVSRERFAVPPNLYLLGTMNTADKSLALLDVALRRRFEFEELPPDFDLCGNMPEAMRTVMTELNERLERCKDRDHRIGHAFFMNVGDEGEFNQVFRRKVVPLLQEYFFNDVNGVRYVLGEAEREDVGGFLRPLEPRSKWQRNHWRWFTDVEPAMNCWARLQTTLGTPVG